VEQPLRHNLEPTRVTSREFKERLIRRARRADVQVSAPLAESLEQYYRILALWNPKINLTALPLSPPEDQTFDRLLIEPLAAAKFLDSRPLTGIDIGSGGGSPAIPLALACPTLAFRMVESKTRKAVFLTEALRNLHIQGVVETGRFEQLLSRPDLHEAADIITVRAVRVETRTLTTLQAFLRAGGQLFWFRSATSASAPSNVPPPLRWTATHPLVDSNSSRLVVLSKDLVAPR
jgi:16S rRNA (guanine527-N7)-methyltransferase